MGLLDGYQQEIKSRGGTGFSIHKKKADLTKPVIALVSAILILAVFFAVYENNSTCSMAAVEQSPSVNGASITSTFSLNCDLYSSLYSVIAIILIIIIDLLILKALRFRKISRDS